MSRRKIFLPPSGQNSFNTALKNFLTMRNYLAVLLWDKTILLPYKSLLFGSFAALTGSCCSVACTQALSGLTPCSLVTTASPPCRPTGLSVYTTTSTDTCGTFAAVMTTSLCWQLAMTGTSSPSACFHQRSCKNACRGREPRFPHPGSVHILSIFNFSSFTVFDFLVIQAQFLCGYHYSIYFNKSNNKN